MSVQCSHIFGLCRNYVSKIMPKAAKQRTNLALRPLRRLALVLRPAPELALALSGNSNSSLLRAPALALGSVPTVSPVARTHLVSPPVRRAPSEARAPDSGSKHNPRLVRSGSLLRVLQVVLAARVSATPPTLRRSDNQPKLRVHSAPRPGHSDSQNHLASVVLAVLPLVRGPASGHSARISNSRSKLMLSGNPRRKQPDSAHLDKAVSYHENGARLV
jgi:hypothetical protein